MKKKNIIFIIIIIFVIIYISIVIRNYIILNNVKNLADKYSNINKFSYVIKDSCKLTKNDNIVKFENYSNNTITYFDLLTNKSIEYNLKTQEKISRDVTNVYIDIDKLNLENSDLISLSFFNIIYTCKYNSENCYVLNKNSYKYYVNVENGLVMKAVGEDDMYEYSYNFDNIENFDLTF